MPLYRVRQIKVIPLPCFVNISTTNSNFEQKIYVAIFRSHLRTSAKLCKIIATFD